jgi:hypothetical protein
MATSYESELELELEGELEGLGGVTHHEGEEEWEHTHEFEHPEHAHEFEADQFFRRIARGIGGFVRRAAPILRTIARVAAPVVGTAIGGPFGAILGRVASQALGEEEATLHEWEHAGAHEFEEELAGAHEWEHAGAHELEEELAGAHEWEHVGAHEWEHAGAHEWEHAGAHEWEHGGAHEWEHAGAHELGHHESAQEVLHEIVHHEITQHEALAHIMAEAAVHEHQEAQAEAMIGAAVVTVLSPRDRRALQRLLPHLVRGAAVLTRILRRRRMTRPAVRAVPTIMRRTVTTLKRQAAAGQPITRRAAGRAAAVEVRRVLGSPSACAAAMRQNVRATRRMRASGAAR